MSENATAPRHDGRAMFHQMLNSRRDPERAYAILSGMASIASAPEKTNNEKLCEMINSCKNPRLVYNALLALAPIIREAKTRQQREALLDALKGDAEA